MRSLLPFLLATLGLTGCDSNDADVEAKTPKTTKAKPAEDEAKSDAAGSEPGSRQAEDPARLERPFAEALAELDPKAAESLPKAVAVFVESYADAETKDEAELRASLGALLDLAETSLPAIDAKVQGSASLNAVACQEAGFGCGEVTAEARGKYAELAKVGLRYVNAGEGTVEAVPDYAQLAKALAPALSESAETYLQLRARQDDVGASFDEGGFEGEPDDIAALIVDWEALANSGPVYEDVGEQGATQALTSYLGLCRHPYQKPVCKVDAQLRASYETFVREHADSAHAEAVERFMAAMKKKKFRASREALEQTVREALGSP